MSDNDKSETKALAAMVRATHALHGHWLDLSEDGRNFVVLLPQGAVHAAFEKDGWRLRTKVARKRCGVACEELIEALSELASGLGYPGPRNDGVPRLAGGTVGRGILEPSGRPCVERVADGWHFKAGRSKSPIFASVVATVCGAVVAVAVAAALLVYLYNSGT